MVLGVFKVIITWSEKKEETEREEKNILPSHHPLLSLVPIILTEA